MTKERQSQQRWAQGRLDRSDQPFTDDNLRKIGTTGGVVIEHPDGKVVVTEDAMIVFLSQVAYRGGVTNRRGVRRLFLMTDKNPDKPND